MSIMILRSSAGSGGGVGASINAGVLTINDTGFSAKPTAAPFYYNNFESQTVGDSATTCGMTSLGGDGTMPLVVTDRSYSGTKSLKCIYPADGAGSKFPRIGHTISPGSQQIIASFMVQWDITTGTISPSPIFKWGRAGAGTPYSGQPQFHETVRPASNGTINGEDVGYTTPIGGSSYGASTFGAPTKSATKALWHWIKYVYKLGTPGGSDGIFQVFVDGIDNIGGVMYNGSQVPVTYGQTQDTGSSALIDWILTIFDGNDTYGAANAYLLWADEMYVDTSMACVVLCDSATISTGTKFAIQPPLTWSDTQITATLKTPGFSSGATGYFHVFSVTNAHVGSYAAVLP